MLVDLVLVNYRSAAEARDAIRSARHELHPILRRVLVIENGSGEAAGFAGAGAEVVALRDNLGFAAAVNIGMDLSLQVDSSGRRAGAALILNPDATLDPGPWLAAVGALAPDVAAIGPAVRSPDGVLQASVYGEPRATRMILEPLGVQRLLRLAGFRRPMPAVRSEVEAAQGSCLLVNHRAWIEVGPFDERFFLYHEEVDWCLRARDAGYQVLYEPSVSITHAGGVDVPPGRELVYYRGAVRLVENRRGPVEASRLRARLRRAALLGSILPGDRERARGLRRVASEL